MRQDCDVVKIAGGRHRRSLQPHDVELTNAACSSNTKHELKIGERTLRAPLAERVVANLPVRQPLRSAGRDGGLGERLALGRSRRRAGDLADRRPVA